MTAILDYPERWLWAHQVWVHPWYPEDCVCPHVTYGCTPQGHTVLYTIYDMHSDGVLYVGITNNVPRRFRQHRRSKPWWHDSENVHLECYSSRRAALAAERDAIRRRRPRFNIVWAV